MFLNFKLEDFNRCVGGQMIGLDVLEVSEELLPPSFKQITDPVINHKIITIPFRFGMPGQSQEKLHFHGKNVRSQKTDRGALFSLRDDLLPLSFLSIYHPLNLRNGRFLHQTNDSFLYRHLSSDFDFTKGNSNRAKYPYNFIAKLS